MALVQPRDNQSSVLCLTDSKCAKRPRRRRNWKNNMANPSTSCGRPKPSSACWPVTRTRKWNGPSILRTSSLSRLAFFFLLKKKEIQFQNFLLRFAQSRIRELERKMELQNVRHDELLLELAALRRNQHPSNSSSHGSSQSLGAGFDLDSRGSSPGTCIIIRSADDEECGREKTRSLILRLSFARFAAILGQRSWIGYTDDSAGTERLQSGRFAGNGFGRV